MERVGFLGVSAANSENESRRTPVQPEILELTRGLASASEDAYREFTRQYSPRLFRYLLVLTHGDEPAAADLLQQTIIKVAHAVRPFHSEHEFWNWLAMLARNCAVDEQRKRKRHWAMLLRFWESKETAFEAPDENQFTTLLAAELNHLAPHDRLLLERKYLDGQSVRELTAQFQTTEKALESRLSRLRSKLKSSLLKKMKYAQPGEQ